VGEARPAFEKYWSGTRDGITNKAMRTADRIRLIAPCGMDCAICSGYLAFSHGVPKRRGAITHCLGCRARNKRCAWLKQHCGRLGEGGYTYCHECPDFPCAHLQHLDERYRASYGMSMVENLELIRRSGTAAFIRAQQARWGCPRCGGLRSVHNGRCFACEVVRHWRS